MWERPEPAGPADWTAIQHRWNLTADPADPAEHHTLTQLAADCPNVPVTITTPA
ncbi:hypothetical protein GCM10027168_70680 [Streptomyces capparidis]